MGGRRILQDRPGFGFVDDPVLGERQQYRFTDRERRVSRRS
jgi:hypothetical protein